MELESGILPNGNPDSGKKQHALEHVSSEWNRGFPFEPELNRPGFAGGSNS
jgi:hypothetical protein